MGVLLMLSRNGREDKHISVTWQAGSWGSNPSRGTPTGCWRRESCVIYTCALITASWELFLAFHSEMKIHQKFFPFSFFYFFFLLELRFISEVDPQITFLSKTREPENCPEPPWQWWRQLETKFKATSQPSAVSRRVKTWTQIPSVPSLAY